DLETICLMCLQKEAKKRYPSAQALADDLHRFLGGEAVHARRTGLWERGIKYAKRRPARFTIFCGTPIAFALLAAALIYAVGKERQAVANERVAHAAEERAREKELQARRQAYRAQLSRAWDKWQETQIGMAEELLDD